MNKNLIELNKSKEPSFSNYKWLLALVLFVFANSVMLSQTVVNSINQLLPYLDDDNVHVKMTPGVYTITADDVKRGKIGSESSVFSKIRVLLPFEGSNSTYDFTGVTLRIETAVFKAFGRYDIFEINITGNNNILKNLTLVDVGSVYDHPTWRATNIVIDGRENRIEGFHMTTKGSWPYGYGDAFGKGVTTTIKHFKHCALLVRGLSNHVKNCTLIHRSYGHAIYMQAADKPIIEGCYIEGEVRKTDDILAETSGPAYDIDFKTVWKYKLPAGYMVSTGEEGIRAYSGGETVIDGVTYKRGTSNPTILNNTIKNMRAGVTLTHATGKKYVEGCVSIGCERGFAIGSGDIVNCSSDAIYGPALGVDYESDSGITADITLLSDVGEYNGSKHLAIIIGKNHDITFRSSDTNFNSSLKLEISGDNRTIGLIGRVKEQSSNNIKIKNLTGYPIILGTESKDTSGESCGDIIDNGIQNKVISSLLCNK
ncbi:hypothetical protein AAFN75_11355 [Algibacter sp. AS12]|uniref:hypothetical protein n=1 Tax=Algibacter sp. AS12 TaxID=3135773 RepID=UPI00398AE411